MRMLIPILLFVGLLALAMYQFSEQSTLEPATPAVEENIVEENPVANDCEPTFVEPDTSYEASLCIRISKERLRAIFKIPAGVEIELTHNGNQAECGVEWYIPGQHRGGGKIMRLVDRRSPASERAWTQREALAQSGELIKAPDIGEVAYYGATYGNLTVAQPGYLVEIYMRPDLGVAPEEMDAETHIRQLAAVYESVEW